MGTPSKLGTAVDIFQEKTVTLQQSRMKVRVLGGRALEKMMA